ncbi:hypothetical protein PO909_033117, partial [Leuciscus waleckii]
IGKLNWSRLEEYLLRQVHSNVLPTSIVPSAAAGTIRHLSAVCFQTNSNGSNVKPSCHSQRKPEQARVSIRYHRRIICLKVWQESSYHPPYPSQPLPTWHLPTVIPFLKCHVMSFLKDNRSLLSVTDNENAGNDPFSRQQMTMTAATECLDQMARGAIALKARPGAICASGFSRAQKNREDGGLSDRGKVCLPTAPTDEGLTGFTCGLDRELIPISKLYQQLIEIQERFLENVPHEIRNIQIKTAR